MPKRASRDRKAQQYKNICKQPHCRDQRFPENSVYIVTLSIENFSLNGRVVNSHARKLSSVAQTCTADERCLAFSSSVTSNPVVNHGKCHQQDAACPRHILILRLYGILLMHTIVQGFLINIARTRLDVRQLRIPRDQSGSVRAATRADAPGRYWGALCRDATVTLPPP
jgi:hypothetical protein